MIRKFLTFSLSIILLAILIDPGLALADRVTSRLQSRSAVMKGHNDFISDKQGVEARRVLRDRSRYETLIPETLPANKDVAGPAEEPVRPEEADEPVVDSSDGSNESPAQPEPEEVRPEIPAVSDPKPAEPVGAPEPTQRETVEKPEEKPADNKADDDKPAPISELSRLEQAAFKAVNDYRAAKGLSVLAWNEKIAEVARRHSQNMASGQVPFSHDGFSARFSEIKGMLGIAAIGENVAYNYGYADPVSIAFDAWLKSAGHRDNIEGNYDLSGLGVVKNQEGRYYLTQIFAR